MGKHTACFPGKKVWVKLKSGEVFFDKFVARQKGRNFVTLENHGKLQMSKIRSFSMYRGPAEFMEKAIEDIDKQHR